jgi:hypothetical protein
MKALIGSAVAVGAALLLGTNGAHAATLSFGCVSNTIAGDCAIGEAQLTAEVTDPGGGQVLFTFNNSGPDDSSIADVYFDDGALLSIAIIINSVGVSFSQGASPGNLPAAANASPPFVTTAGFSADSDSPVQPNGVNPGEVLGIRFDLQPGQTFNDVLADLADGTLRIGLHVQGYESGGSESFVNAPEPTALVLSGLVVAALAGMRRLRA